MIEHYQIVSVRAIHCSLNIRNDYNIYKSITSYINFDNLASVGLPAQLFIIFCFCSSNFFVCQFTQLVKKVSYNITLAVQSIANV